MDLGFKPPEKIKPPISLGILDLYSAGREKFIKRIPLSVKGEVKPPWEKPFKGYPTIYHALSAATLSRKACVIVLVGTFPGLFDKRDRLAWFRVFETTYDKYSFDRKKYLLSRNGRENPPNTLEVRYVNFYSRKHSESWQELKKQYVELGEPSFAKSVICDKLDLTENEVSIYDGEIRSLHILKKNEHIVKRLDTDTLSFNQFDTSASGTTYNLNIQEASSSIESTKIPKAHLVLNELGFLRPTPTLFMSTILHEAVHEIDIYRLRYQINRWRERSQLSKRTPEFLAWLIDKVEKKDDGFVDRDILVAVRHLWGTSKRTAKVFANPTQRYGLLKAQSHHLHHFEPHLHGLAYKLWLDKFQVARAFRAHMNNTNTAAGFIYFEDINKLDSYIVELGYKSADRLIELAVKRIVDVVMACDPLWVPLLKQFVKDSIDEARRQDRGIFFALLDTALSKLK